MQPADTIHHRICPLCEACCGLEVKVRAGKVISIRGHDADVFSAGYICPKGVALKDLHEDPDRLRTPLIKRDGVFVEATWDEAFTEINRRLPPLMAAHGKDSVAVMAGNPSAHKIGLLLYFARLAKALGTRNVFSASTLDQMPKQLSSGLLFGHWLSIPVPDITRCDYLLMLGANPLASNGSLWTVPDFKGKAKAMQARGGKLVVIDPRRTETAAMADAHHFIRPGGDAFLMLGMLHTLFDEKLTKVGRLAEWVNGLAEVESAVAPFGAEAVAARCGIDAGTIRQLARTLASTPRAAVYGRIGTCTQEFGTLASWLVDVLNIVTGHLDEAGGAMFPKAAAFAANTTANTAGRPGTGKGISTGRHHSRVSGAPEVMGELPAGCLAEEIETPGPGQIKAFVSIATNPVLSSPNGPRLARALDKLDFMVSMDIYVNETSRHADVILPGPSALEDMHYDVAFPQFSWRNHARYSEPVFERAAGQPDEWETLTRLAGIVQGKGCEVSATELDDEQFARDAARLFGEHASAVIKALGGLKGPDRMLDVALRSGPYGDGFGRKPEGLTLQKVKSASGATGGIDLGELTPRIPEVLRTQSGKIELAAPCLLVDLQRAVADLARPVPAMVIIGRREVRSNNSWMHNLPLLAKGPFRCTALLHPLDAARLGLADGAMAKIASLHAKGKDKSKGDGKSVLAQIHITDTMMPGVVSLPHGWGHDKQGARLGLAAERPGVNLNDLLDEQLRDPLSGNAVLGGVAVELSAIAIN
ncbi:MAG: molybdopterin-dependent oxidoreductase [Polaromonas sp.]|nr:molybdopterin-dependent oxidoreductase [Polaromonas sp.]